MPGDTSPTFCLPGHPETVHVCIPGDRGRSTGHLEECTNLAEEIVFEDTYLSESVQCGGQTDPPRPPLRHLFPWALGGALVPAVP